MDLIMNKEKRISIEDKTVILRAMGNSNRLTILTALSLGEKTLTDLKEETKLKRTALSNHLTKLIRAGLISKPYYNKYCLTSDGELFYRTFDSAYLKSDFKAKKLLDDPQRGQFSDSFVKSFFG